ncbi:MAG: glycosyltransferase family 39 protein [Pseudomonadota bacterium]
MSSQTSASSPFAPETSSPFALLWLLLLLLALAAYRAFIVHSSGMNLYLDEAYYLSWSRDLAFGYYSKPPVIAWTLAAFTSVCGEGELCVKLSAFFWYAVGAVFAALLAMRLFGREFGTVTGLAFYTMPAVGYLSMTASTDAPLLAFWALSLWLFALALDEQPGAWVALGVAMGLGFLSKYTMVVFPLCMFLYLMFSREDRSWLRMGGPWVALLIAVLVFSPNLWWNYENGFPSVTHTAELAQWSGEHDSLGALLEFVGAQFLVFGLISFAVLIIACLLPSTWRDPRTRLLVWFTLPLLSIYMGQAWLGGAYINWALASYVAATVLVVAFLRTRGAFGSGLLVALIAINIAATSLVYHWREIAPLVGVELSRKTDPWSRILGWREIGADVRARREAHPQAALLADRRLVLSQLTYYGRTPEAEWSDVAAWNPDGGISNQFELTSDITVSEQDTFLYVGKEPLEALAPAFESAWPLEGVRHEVYPDRVLEYSVYLLQGFRGYDALRAADGTGGADDSGGEGGDETDSSRR